MLRASLGFCTGYKLQTIRISLNFNWSVQVFAALVSPLTLLFVENVVVNVIHSLNSRPVYGAVYLHAEVEVRGAGGKAIIKNLNAHILEVLSYRVGAPHRQQRYNSEILLRVSSVYDFNATLSQSDFFLHDSRNPVQKACRVNVGVHSLQTFIDESVFVSAARNSLSIDKVVYAGKQNVTVFYEQPVVLSRISGYARRGVGVPVND